MSEICLILSKVFSEGMEIIERMNVQVNSSFLSTLLLDDWKILFESRSFWISNSLPYSLSVFKTVNFFSVISLQI